MITRAIIGLFTFEKIGDGQTRKKKNFIKEVERLKELWYPNFINSPQAEISTREALANLRTSRTYLKIERENAERHEENDLLTFKSTI